MNNILNATREQLSVMRRSPRRWFCHVSGVVTGRKLWCTKKNIRIRGVGVLQECLTGRVGAMLAIALWFLATRRLAQMSLCRSALCALPLAAQPPHRLHDQPMLHCLEPFVQALLAIGGQDRHFFAAD